MSIKNLEEKLTPIEQVLKYLAFAPWFFVSLPICLGICYFKIQTTTPIFKSTTNVLVKTSNDNKIGGSRSSGGGSGDLVESSIFSNRQINLDNELAMLSATPLLRRVVDLNQFNYYYYQLGKFRIKEISTPPFRVEVNQWADSSETGTLFLAEIDQKGGIVSLSSIDKKKKAVRFQWGQEIDINHNRFRILRATEQLPAPDNLYKFECKSVAVAASEIKSSLVIAPYGVRTTIIKLELKGANPKKIPLILDAIVKEYDLQSVLDKNKVLVNTIDFIGQRLNLVTKELGDVETNIKDFKQENKILDIGTQTGSVLSQSAQIQQQLVQMGVQQQLYKMFYQQAKNMQLDPQLLPVNIGISTSNEKLPGAIEQYNQLVLKKQREELSVGKNNPILVELKLQISQSYNQIMQILEDYGQAMEVQRKSLEKSLNQFDGMLSQAPAQEKTLIEIKRQQNVKEGLYLYLLQKREETAIATSSTISNYTQLDPAIVPYSPIEPNEKGIYAYGILAGLIIPVLIIFLIDLLNDKILNRLDITKRTKMPIIAEVSHVQNSNRLIVADKSRDHISEQFRILRTNLSFLLQDNNVILLTSGMAGEGKSFVALNLAAVLAITGKKVALLEFDLRKPGLVKKLKVKKNTIGLSNFLSKQTDDLKDLYIPLENYTALHLYGCGPIPPNPAELMVGDRMKLLFSKLKNEYDYIIIDTAPIGLVSDAFSLMDIVDTCLYVIRQRKSLKKQLNYVDDLYSNKQLKNVGLVFNDVKVGGRYGYYGHNYGYGYGVGGAAQYNYNYGYGYGLRKTKGYGEIFESNTIWEKFLKAIKNPFNSNNNNKKG